MENVLNMKHSQKQQLLQQMMKEVCCPSHDDAISLLCRDAKSSSVDEVKCCEEPWYWESVRYLTDYCIPISDVANRQHRFSARRRYLVVPRHSLSSYGRRAFAVAGPTAWNSPSDDLHDPTLSTDSF